MQVQSIPHQNTYSTSFNGILKIKGNVVPKEIRMALENAHFVKNMKANNDVVARVKYISPTEADRTIGNDGFFNVQFSILRENSVTDQLKDFFHMLPRHNITRNFYPEMELIERIKNPNYGTKLMNKFTYEI